MSEPLSAKQALRSRLEEQLKKQEEEQRKELLRKRIEIAKEGARLYHSGKVIEALKYYQRYLLILELWKKCGRDELSPVHFDKSKDLYELVLISGIYWDLARLYDRGKRGHQVKELKMMLNKFVLFSKGFPFQPLSSEAIRRYIGSGKCHSSEPFKEAYKELSGDGCFIATMTLPELEWEDYETLRRVRDRLKTNRYGAFIVRAYENLSPKFVSWVRTQLSERTQCFVRTLCRKSLTAAARALKALDRFAPDEN